MAVPTAMEMVVAAAGAGRATLVAVAVMARVVVECLAKAVEMVTREEAVVAKGLVVVAMEADMRAVVDEGALRAALRAVSLVV